MKPILLSFGAFGPYVETQVIDFRKLEKNGIFLISGETGSGKTMMLDAMTYALYGKSSGNLRNDFKTLRSTQAEWNQVTFVRFIFETAGDYYKFERRLEPKTKNLSEKYEACVYTAEVNYDEFVDSLWEPLFENPKKSDLDHKAVELIGLDYDQFRQVIILPQGQFEKLLVSTSDEKEKILTTIFGVTKWQRIAELLYENAEKRKNELQTRKAAMDSSLSEEGCSSIEELGQKINELSNKLSETSAKQSQDDNEKKLEVLQEALRLCDRFGDLHRAKAKQDALESQIDKQKEYEEKLSVANRAEKIRKPLEDYKNASAEHIKRSEELEVACKRIEESKNKLESAEKSLAEHQKKNKDIEVCREERIICEQKRADYQSIDLVRCQLEAVEKSYNEQLSVEKKADDDLAIVQKAVDELLLEVSELNNLTHVLTEKYLLGIGGELAEKLIDGEPCPVCGSTSHPHKATKHEDHVSKEDMDKADECFQRKKNELDEKTRERDALVVKLNEEKDKSANQKALCAAKKAEYEKASDSLLAGIANINELDDRIVLLDKKISEHEVLLKTLTSELETAKEQNAKCVQELESATKEKNKTEAIRISTKTLLIQSIEDSGFVDENDLAQKLMSDDKRSELIQQIADYQSEVKATRQLIQDISSELVGKEEPVKSQILEKINETKEAIKAYASELARTTQEKNRLEKKYESIMETSSEYASQIQEAEADFVFAKGLRGDTGTGLQRYVLGIMFDSVIAAANKMLELVHDGRYYLVRTDDKEQGSNKRGLGLKAHDKCSENAEPRFVGTMSGGEKFLISLALSIGLSHVARKGGIRIEALFIDEGFGSLDDDSIEDAMNVLDTVQKTSGVLGIISHVQLLQERISTKLIVDKNHGKSSICQNVG